MGVGLMSEGYHTLTHARTQTHAHDGINCRLGEVGTNNTELCYNTIYTNATDRVDYSNVLHSKPTNNEQQNQIKLFLPGWGFMIHGGLFGLGDTRKSTKKIERKQNENGNRDSKNQKGGKTTTSMADRMRADCSGRDGVLTVFRVC